MSQKLSPMGAQILVSISHVNIGVPNFDLYPYLILLNHIEDSWVQFSVTWYLIARLSFLTTSGRTSGNLLSLEMEMMLLWLDLRLMWSPNNEVACCRCPRMGEPQSSNFSNRFPKFLPRNLAKKSSCSQESSQVSSNFSKKFPRISQSSFFLTINFWSFLSLPPKSARFPHCFRGFGPKPHVANTTPHAGVFQGHGQSQRGVGKEVVPRPRNAWGTGALAATRGRSEGGRRMEDGRSHYSY